MLFCYINDDDLFDKAVDAIVNGFKLGALFKYDHNINK